MLQYISGTLKAILLILRHPRCSTNSFLSLLEYLSLPVQKFLRPKHNLPVLTGLSSYCHLKRRQMLAKSMMITSILAPSPISSLSWSKVIPWFSRIKRCVKPWEPLLQFEYLKDVVLYNSPDDLQISDVRRTRLYRYEYNQHCVIYSSPNSISIISKILPASYRVQLSVAS